IPDLDAFRLPTGCQRLAIRAKGDTANPAWVALDGKQPTARRGFPESDISLVASRGNEPTVRTEGDARDLPNMSLFAAEPSLGPARGQVPNQDGTPSTDRDSPAGCLEGSNAIPVGIGQRADLLSGCQVPDLDALFWTGREEPLRVGAE